MLFVLIKINGKRIEIRKKRLENKKRIEIARKAAINRKKWLPVHLVGFLALILPTFCLADLGN